MGHAQGYSMLYLEARCLAAVRAAGSQGVQNGSISCVALVLALPGGTREILAENLLAAWLDLEVASGNDAIASHSEIRKTAKLMGQFLPGTDFVTSGYSVMPRNDNMFGGGNYDADDLDEWMTVQRDWQVDAGIEPSGGGRARRCSERGARAVQAVFEELGLPADLRRGGRGRDLRLYEQGSPRPRPGCRRRGRRPADRVRNRRARRRSSARRAWLRRRRRSDRRHAAPARLRRLPPDLGRDRRGLGRSTRPSTTRTLHRPGHGLPARGRALAAAAVAAVRRRSTRVRRGRRRGAGRASTIGEALPGDRADEVVVAVGPAFGDVLRATINGLAHADVLTALVKGSGRMEAEPRIVRVRRAADVAFIGHDGARLSGSGIAVGHPVEGHGGDPSRRPASRSTTSSCSACHRCTRSTRTGRSAETRPATRSAGRSAPVPTMMDNFARAKLIVKTTLLHARETEAIVPGAPAIDSSWRTSPAARPRPRYSPCDVSSTASSRSVEARRGSWAGGAPTDESKELGAGLTSDTPVLRRMPSTITQCAPSPSLVASASASVSSCDELRHVLVGHPEVVQLDLDQRHRQLSLVGVTEPDDNARRDELRAGRIPPSLCQPSTRWEGKSSGRAWPRQGQHVLEVGRGARAPPSTAGSEMPLFGVRAAPAGASPDTASNRCEGMSCAARRPEGRAERARRAPRVPASRRRAGRRARRDVHRDDHGRRSVNEQDSHRRPGRSAVSSERRRSGATARRPALFGGAPPADRDARVELPLRPLLEIRRQLGLDEARRDGVDPDDRGLPVRSRAPSRAARHRPSRPGRAALSPRGARPVSAIASEPSISSRGLAVEDRSGSVRGRVQSRACARRLVRTIVPAFAARARPPSRSTPSRAGRGRSGVPQPSPRARRASAAGRPRPKPQRQ